MCVSFGLYVLYFCVCPSHHKSSGNLELPPCVIYDIHVSQVALRVICCHEAGRCCCWHGWLGAVSNHSAMFADGCCVESVALGMWLKMSSACASGHLNANVSSGYACGMSGWVQPSGSVSNAHMPFWASSQAPWAFLPLKSFCWCMQSVQVLKGFGDKI